MTQMLLEPPPSRAEPAKRAVLRPSRPRPRDPRWLLPAGLAGSVALHVLAFMLFRFTTPSYSEAFARARAQRAAAPSNAIRVVRVVPIQDDTGEPVVPVPEPPPELVPQVETPPSAAVTEPVLTAPAPVTSDRLSLSERTRPRSTDPRLWNLPSPVEPEVDEFTAALIPLYARLNELADSMMATGLAAERALDWTVTDSNGNKWGFSPGRIHLGKITLPMLFPFVPPPGRRGEYNGRIDGWTAIQRQAGQAAVRAEIEERARAMRERAKAARDTTRRGGGG